MAKDSTLYHIVEPLSEAVQFATPPIQIHVGNPPTTFHINSALLSQHSPFFKAALKKRWFRAPKRTLSLPEIEPHIFNIYLNFLHRGRLPVGLDPDQDPEKVSTWPVLIAAYALGDFLLDTDFKDAITDAMALTTLHSSSGKWTYPHVSFRRQLYDVTLTGSKARELMVRIMVCAGLLGEDGDHEDLKGEVRRVREEVRERERRGEVVLKPKGVAWTARECGFHEHAEGKCYRVGRVEGVRLGVEKR